MRAAMGPGPARRRPVFAAPGKTLLSALHVGSTMHYRPADQGTAINAT